MRLHFASQSQQRQEKISEKKQKSTLTSAALLCKVMPMNPKWASDNLRVIRVLMERTALYRRALGPLMVVVGATGLAAGVVGASLKLHPPLPAVGYWLCIAVVCLAEACWMTRLQALRQREKFWSSPMRRVVQALMPAFTAGLLAGLPLFMLDLENNQTGLFIVPAWMVLYGIAMHAAGFFMPRGFKLFGWGFVLGGVGIFGCVLAAIKHDIELTNLTVHCAMGGLFGGTHLAYGLYLHFTERREMPREPKTVS
jgi:hypothetical protein